MTRFTLPVTIIFLGFLVAILHGYALSNFLYWHFPWFDIVMHFLGGLLVSLFGLWAFMKYHTGYDEMPKALLLFDIILFTFIVGLFWETLELLFGLIVNDPWVYVVDTIADFLMNTIGAMVGYFLVQAGHLFTHNIDSDE